MRFPVTLVPPFFTSSVHLENSGDPGLPGFFACAGEEPWDTCPGDAATSPEVSRVLEKRAQGEQGCPRHECVCVHMCARACVRACEVI